MSADLEYISVDRYNDLYLLDFIVLIDVPENSVRNILEDPEQYVHINTSIQEIQELESPDENKQRIKFHVTECIWFFCVDFTNVHDIGIREDGDISVRLVPEMSDFEMGHSLWRTEAVSEQQTRLSYYGENKPSFWVPPLIGTAIIKSRLHELAMMTAQRVECDYRQFQQCDELMENDGNTESQNFQ